MFKSKRMKLYMCILLVCYVVLLVRYGFKPPINADKPLKVTVVELYTIQPNDTLTSICSQYKHTDIREFIYDVEVLNNITPVLKIGSEIKIPVEVD